MSWIHNFLRAFAAFVLGLASGGHGPSRLGSAPPDAGVSIRPASRLSSLIAGTSAALAAEPRIDANSPVGGIGPCPTYLNITRAPRAQLYDAVDTMAVEFGETVTTRCISTLGPEPSSLRVTVNGVDRTTSFAIGEGVAESDTVPLVVSGDSLPNQIIVSADGYDANGAAIRMADTATSVRYAGVEVASLDGPVTLTHQSEGTYRFVVRNRSWKSEVFTRSCAVTGAVEHCGMSGIYATKQLLPAQRDTVVVTGITGNATGQGIVGLTATGVTIAVGEDTSEVVPPVRLRVFSPVLDKVDRSVCPTVGAGPGAAVQCGHLLYVYGLPAYRSMGKTRSLTMLYNSETADPTPMLAVQYLKLVGDATPDMVALLVARTAPASPLVLDTAYFTLPAFDAPGVIQYRLVMPVQHDSVRRTGMHPVEATLYGRYNGVWNWNTPLGSTSARLLVVNREQSVFGAGWWPAGIERLHPGQPDGGTLLELPDGSALHYRLVDGKYMAPPGDRSRLQALPEGGFKRTLEGERLTVTYDALGRVLSVGDNNPVPNVATYWWTGDQPDSLRDAGQAIVRFRRDSAGFLITTPVTDSARFVVSGGNVVRIREPDGFVDTLTYQSGTRRLLTTRGRGTGTYRYTWDALQLVDSLLPPAGAARQYVAWQRAGGAAIGTNSEQAPAAAASGTPVFAFLQRRVPDGLSVIDRYEATVDRSGAPLVSSTPVGSTEVQRDSIGRAIFVRTPNGGRVWQQYDSTGLLVRTIAEVVPGQVGRDTLMRYDTTTYRWDARWRVPTTVWTPPHDAPRDTTRDSTRFTYDSLGRRTKVIDGRGHATEFHYTARGQVDSIWAPAPSGSNPREPIPTVTTYDPVTLNVLSTGKGVNTITYGYARENRYDLRTATDAVGTTTEYGFDPIGRVTQVKQYGLLDAASRTTKYLYDDANRVRTQIDPNGAQSVWYQDEAGRVIRSCVRVSWCERVEYGDDVNPTHAWDKAGTPSVLTFDGGGRVTKKVVFADPMHPDSMSFEYDAAGNPTAIINAYSRIHRGYDEFGRLTRETQAIRGLAPDTNREMAVTVYHRYDANGRRSATYIHGLGTPYVKVCRPRPLLDDEVSPCRYPVRFIPTDSIAYGYDAVNLTVMRSTMWQTAAAVGNNDWHFEYDNKDRLQRFKVPKVSGYLTVTRSYDDEDRLIGLSGLPNLGNETITPDALGRIQTYAFGGSIPTSYVYDALGQLKEVTGDPEQVGTFAYDSAGNRRRDKHWTLNYDGRGQLSQRSDSAVGGGCLYLYQHDGNGNTRQQAPFDASACADGRVTRMEYDGFNRMRRHQFDTPRGARITRDYWYDGLGRRIIMRTDESTGSPSELGTWRYFWIDDHVLVQTRTDYDSTVYNEVANPWVARDGSGALQGRGQWFLYGPGMDNVLATWNREQTGERRLLYANSRGNVVTATDENGAVTGNAMTYQPFGAGGTSNQPGFNGLSGSGGLVYMRNRWYDPNTGRFTQQDPIGFAGGINLYAYAGNDPVNYADPFGLSPEQQGDSTVEVGCRRLEGAAGAVGNHCAVRVTVGDSSRVGELLNDGGKNKIVWWGPGNASVANAYNWIRVNASAGAVTATFNRLGAALAGREYSAAGNVNSNRFVFDVITGAGGRVPSAVVPTHGATPGICGGSPSVMLGGWVGGAATGNQCSP